MRRLLPAAALLVLAVAAPPALAGGWASVTISSSPQGTAPGETWRAELTVLQHGRTPIRFIEPAVVVTAPSGRETRFPARATGKPGVYAANVVFPKAGRYSYTVDDGFTNAVRHDFPPVQIAAAAPAGPAGGDDGLPWWPFAAVGALALLLIAARAFGAPAAASSNAAPRSARAAARGRRG